MRAHGPLSIRLRAAPRPDRTMPRFNSTRPGLLAAGACLAIAAPDAALACLACGCTLNADWASQGLVSQPGWSLDLRHDILDQSELRSGTGRVDRQAITFPTDDEIQVKTFNHFTTLSIDDGIDEDWGVTLQLPWIDRFHTTIAEGDTAVSSVGFSQFGDARILGRYTGFSRAGDWGLQFGLKLPTGKTGVDFVAGPQAGTPLDRGLQPGTGSTDALLGAFAFGTLGDEHASTWGWFGNALLQVPVAHDSTFRPGHSLTMTGGLRWMAFGNVAPQAQFNARFDGRESGPGSDAPNSGDTLVSFSPGLSWAATSRFSVYAFGQLPVYQRVDGLQLEPRWSLSAGMHFAF
jgi:hypothetical protein